MSREDRASALVHAPRELVYHAFVDPSAVARWLPPTGSAATLEAFEPRPGGAFRMTLTFDSGGETERKTSENSDTVDGRFVELDPPRLIVQQFEFVSDNPKFGGTMTMRWSLTDEPGGTRVTVVASNVPLGISAKDHESGMASSLANLAEYVEATSGTEGMADAAADR